jgi:hypothetical protein
MFKTPTIELNEYIEKFSEIKPHLDQLIENINIEEVMVINEGCKAGVTLKVFRYLHNHDIRTIRVTK